MFGFLQRLKTNQVWSIGVYVATPDFFFDDKLQSPVFVLDARKPRKAKAHVHTYADPFLFAHKENLYLFYESQAVGQKGKIEAYRTSNLKEFLYLGEILREDFHLSFPFVFSHGPSVFLIPETAENSEVSLYRFADFPYTVVKERTLLKGVYFDSSVIRHRDVWYLFTTSSKGLEIFFTDDLEKGAFTSHPQNPITNDPKYNRCGGGLVEMNNQLYRIAQDGSAGYGRNINIMRIRDLSKNAYDEEVFIDKYFELNETWNSRGGHHLSLTDFNGQMVIAVDGKQNDLFINKFLALMHRH